MVFDAEALDRHITGNYGMDQWPDIPCVVHGRDCDADTDECEPVDLDEYDPDYDDPDRFWDGRE